ncbi:hypothetical protein [uncultured Jatrophihabitans sp.]|uniref:hypothetical protein n=1 Tax=uncultured Jatrophihabitans sp. TaxID=1610747 RepID=UPI0035CC995A
MLALLVVLVVLLALTTALAVVALVLLVRRPPAWLLERVLEVDATAAAALDRTPRPPTVAGMTRRLISVEILNALELAGTRGRLASIAGSLAPGITRRIVYDQTLKILKEQLVAQQVRADVRLHVLKPGAEPAVTVDRPIELGDPSA